MKFDSEILVLEYQQNSFNKNKNWQIHKPNFNQKDIN
jgi:hypothetical protein